MSKLRIARIAAVAGIVLCALPAVNCFISGGRPHVGFRGSTGKSSTPANHCLFIQGTPNNTGSTIRTDRRLYPPYRWEGTIGLFDAKHANLGTAGFGISLIADGFGGFEGVTLKLSGDGVDIVPATSGSGPTPQATTLHVAGAHAAQVALVHDGTFVIVYARPVGATVYTELERQAAPKDTFQPSIDSDTLPVGVRVGFDELQVVNTTRKPGLTPIENLREDTYLAADAATAAGYAADGPAPDDTTAGTFLATARDRLQAVIAGADAAGASAKAKKKLNAALKVVLKGIAALQGHGPASAYYKPVFAAGKAIMNATKEIK